MEFGYSALAVMEVITSMITVRVGGLVGSVEALVGVVSFDFLEEEGEEGGDGKERKSE